jgi:RNA polymerase sigma factor (sigma-70 family)
MKNRFEHPQWAELGVMKTSLTLENFLTEWPSQKQTVIWICTDHPDWQAWLRALSTDHKCAVMTFQKKLAEFQLAVNLGAKAYVEATANATILTQISDTLQAGSMWIPAELLTKMIGTTDKLLQQRTKARALQQPNFDNISPREQEVAEYVCQGMSNKQIAQTLDITERTVKQHMSNLLAKTQATDRMQLMLKYRDYSS